MTDEIIKGKKCKITYNQLDYMEKCDNETWHRYYKLTNKNKKIRIRMKIIFLIFIISIFLIGWNVRYSIMNGSYNTYDNILDLIMSNKIYMIGVYSGIYLGTVVYGFLITNINNKEILKIAQEYGTVE